MHMTTFRAYIILAAILVGIANRSLAQGKNDHGHAIAGKYDGNTFIELMQVTLPLQVELQRVRDDSVIVKIANLALPNGQIFSFTSRPLSVKPALEQGKQIYHLRLAFSYTYNNMPLRVQVAASVKGKELEGEVKAVIMESMETKATYKGKKTT
ncbi:MAG: hypothetical protein LBD64_00085 [Odoribacteraceae bacterium]|jgi:hypothetical protein|nr:hypothetical protein [Odoribacteraceae bacterium]